MDPLYFALTIGIFLFGFGAVIFILRKERGKVPDTSAIVLLQNQLNELSRVLDQKLGESTRAIQHQFGESAKIVRDVTERLTRLDETNRQVVNFADQLKNLQDILKNPKQRGVLGEYYLETILKNVFPPGSYQMQYSFKDGVIVDAVVFLDKQIIPIDSKFSLENYNRMIEARDPMVKSRHESAFIADIKHRIDETAKYVKPQENTMDFALMFVPSEGVFYDVVNNRVGGNDIETSKNLLEYAYSKHVNIVGPSTFLAFLQTVLQGLRNQKISAEAREIIKQVENLGRHLGAYDGYMQKLGKNIGATVSMYNSAYKEFAKIDKDIVKISGRAMEIEPLEIEKPQADEVERQRML